MADIVEIVHDLSYQVSGQENIKKVSDEFEKSVNRIDKMKAKLAELQKQLANTSSVNEQQKLSGQILKTQKAIEGQTKAASQNLAQSKAFSQEITRQSGIIEQLRDKMSDLARAREKFTDVKQINEANRALRETQNELNLLLDKQKETGGGRGLFPELLGIGSATGTGKQIFQGALAGLGIGVGFSVLPAITSSLIKFAQTQFDVYSQIERTAQANDTLSQSLSNLDDELFQTIRVWEKYLLTTKSVYAQELLLSDSLEGSQRELARVQAEGVTNGQIFSQEVRERDARIKVKEREIELAQKEIEANKNVIAEIERLKSARKEVGAGGLLADVAKTFSTPEGKGLGQVFDFISTKLRGEEGITFSQREKTAIDNAIQGANLPTKVVERLRVAIEKAKESGANFFNVFEDISRDYGARSTDLTNKLTTLQENLKNVTIQLERQKAREIFDLNLKLYQDINALQDQYAQAEIKRQETTVDNIVNSINIERNARERAIALKEQQARDQFGSVPKSVQENLNRERELIEKEFDAKITEAKRVFYRQQLSEAEKFNKDLLNEELRSLKQRLSEVSIQELTDNISLREQVIDKELQIQQAGIAAVTESRTLDLQKKQRELEEAGKKETQEYKLLTDQITAIEDSAAQEQEDNIRASNIRKLNIYADYFKKVVFRANETQQQLISELNVETSQQSLDIETGGGGLFGRQFQMRILQLDKQAKQAEIRRNAKIEELTAAQIRLNAIETKLADTTLGGSERTAAEKEYNSAVKAVNDLTAEVTGNEAVQAKAVKDAQNAKIDAYINSFMTIEKTAADFYTQINEMRQRDLQREIQARTQRVNTAIKLAEFGNTAVLNEEQKRLDAAQRANRKAALEQQAINSALQLSYSLAAVAKATLEGGAVGAAATVAAVLAALATGYSLASNLSRESQTTGFEKGGYTGEMGTKEVAGVVHGKEFVFDAKNTQRYRPIFEHIHKTGRLPSLVEPTYFSNNTAPSNRDINMRLDELIDRMDNLHINQYIGENGIRQSVVQSARKQSKKWYD